MKSSMSKLVTRRIQTFLVCFSVALIAPGSAFDLAQAASSTTIKVLKAEPGPGKLNFGVKVFVDDGSCPTGKIKQMFRASKSSPREKKCVAWKNAKPTKMLKKEPGKGMLQAGAIVIVDDGTCPAGKVKQVRGGGGSKGRQRTCIDRP